MIRRWATVFILLAAFWLRMADLYTMPGGLHNDEAQIVASAWRIAQGYGLPLVFWDRPEPFDTIIRGGWMQLAGPTPFASRLLSVWLGVLAAAAAIAAARVLYWSHAHRETVALFAGLALAVMPTYVLIGRSIYRVNWLPPAEMLALAALFWAWRTDWRRYWIATGVLTGLAAMFYLAGLAFPAAMAAVLCIYWVKQRTWPNWRNLLALGAAGAVVMLPWLYFYLRIPNWLGWRVDMVAPGGVNAFESPANFLQALTRAIEPIFRPGLTYYDYIRYNPFTTAFLNPALAAFCVVGIAASLWWWRRQGSLVPLVVVGVMLLPAVFSDRPETPTRLAGIFGPLALLVGRGAGAWVSTLSGRRYAWLAAALVVVGSPIYTYTQVQYHYRSQPRVYEDPDSWYSLNAVYNLAYRDLLFHIADSRQAVYIPVEYVDHPVAMGWLRPAFPVVRPLAPGESLPAGVVILPPGDGYVFPAIGTAVQYVLVAPTAGEMVILPPLPIEDALALQKETKAAGELLFNDASWRMGHTMPINDVGRFERAVYPEDRAGVFDGRLELVGIDAPRELAPDTNIPVTLYWRLREQTGTDYFAFVQAFGLDAANWGGADGHIFRWLYPTPMWQPGEVVAETRWLHLLPSAPAGGYRFLVGVYTQPEAVHVEAVNAAGIVEPSGWVLAGRAVVPLPPASPPEDALALDVQVGESIRLTHAAFDPPPETLAPGDTLTVTLYWEAIAAPPEDYHIFVHLMAGDALLAQHDAAPLDGRYPTGFWAPGERVATTHPLTLPADAAGPFQLFGGMYTWPEIEPLDVVQDGVPQAGRAKLYEWP